MQFENFLPSSCLREECSKSAYLDCPGTKGSSASFRLLSFLLYHAPIFRDCQHFSSLKTISPYMALQRQFSITTEALARETSFVRIPFPLQCSTHYAQIADATLSHSYCAVHILSALSKKRSSIFTGVRKSCHCIAYGQCQIIAHYLC